MTTAKIRAQQSLGLTPRGKLIGQIVVSVLFAVAAVSFADDQRPDAGSSGYFSGAQCWM